MADDFVACTALAARVGEALLARGASLATAESCTGGWVAMCLTEIAGSSAWFERGLVTYSNAAKQSLLGVPEALLATHGAVSEQSALAMAAGVLNHAPVDWSLAITGIAGPSGATPGKPVGMVCFAWGQRSGGVEATTRYFEGDRHAVRAQAVAFALDGLLVRLSQSPSLA